MERIRIYVLTTLGSIFLASLSLWLVPQSLQHQLEAAERGKALPPGMTFKQAQAQVDSALQTYVDGILKGDMELALAGFARNDPGWLAEQRQVAQQAHTRLASHPARVRHTSGYYIFHFGRPDSVSSAWYAGALVIQDSLSGEIVDETPYFARAHTRRFLLSRPPEDISLQMSYRLNLGSLYRQLGMEQRALVLWKRALDEFPAGPENLQIDLWKQIAQVYESQENYAEAFQTYEQALKFQSQDPLVLYDQLGNLHESRGNYAEALQVYERALGYVQSQDAHHGIRMGGMQVQGKFISARKEELLKYQLAQCNLKLNQVEKARALCQELAKSQTKELAAAARRLLEEQ
jgi:tetratricopeptide (TPR) repeat protein